MIVGVVGAGGGVGASTFALLLAKALAESNDGPESAETVLVEADPAGGVVGTRFDLGFERGVGSWVAGLAAEPGLSVAKFGKTVAPGLRVLVAPGPGSDAERVLSSSGSGSLASAVGSDVSRWWVLDLGRGLMSVRALLSVCDVVVIVSSGLPAEVVRLRALVGSARPGRCVVVLGDRSPWSAGEVGEHCSADVVLSGSVGNVSGAVVAGLVEGRRRRRSGLWRSVLSCREAVLASSPMASEAERSAS